MPAPEKVQITELLRNALIADGFNPDDFGQYFAEWKSDFPESENLDYYFGKDGFYDLPKRGGRRVLRHVHLPPNEPGPGERPSEAYQKWMKKLRHGSRKTSDTSLIYAHDPGHGFLLIFIAREPNGHLMTRMDTPDSRKFMEALADVAERFIFNGEIMI